MPKMDYSEEYETQLTKQNLDKLCRFLIMLNRDDDWENPQLYHITEYFPFDKPDKPLSHYDLHNITMSIENDGVAYCDDAEGVLDESMKQNSPLRLQAIVINDILYLGLQNNVITISLADGYIKIEY